jgi:hypothetical protein
MQLARDLALLAKQVAAYVCCSSASVFSGLSLSIALH